jgi:hypothetical protein
VICGAVWVIVTTLMVSRASVAATAGPVACQVPLL